MKRALITTLQILVTATLLWWIFRDPAQRAEMAAALRAAAWGWLLPGLAAVGLGCVLQTERWRQLLSVQGIAMGWWRTFRVYMIGAFFNLFLLGATGGDVVKMYYAMRETASKKSAALLSVLVDRMMGLVGLVVLTAVVIAARWQLLTAHALTQGLLGTLVLVMGIMLGLIAAGFVVDRFHLASRLPAWLPLHGKIIELAHAFSIYARDGRVLMATLGLSLACHVCNFFGFYFAARAFGQFPGFSGVVDVASVLPVVMTMAALPISVSGLGVREVLFAQMFAVMFGTPEAASKMISMTGFLMFVFWGMVGGAIYLFYRPSGGLHLRDVAREVESTESQLEQP